MKKVIALVLSLMMFMACIGAVAEEEPEPENVEVVEEKTEPMTIDPKLVLGDWYGETSGVVINIRLKDDGTAECFVGDAETSDDLIWSLNGDVITISSSDGSDPLSGSYTDDTLPLASEDGMQVLFVREKIEVYSPADPNLEATIEDFDGTWDGAYAYMSGAMVSMKEVSDEHCTISEGKVVFAGEDSSMVTLFGTDPVELVFDHGALSYKQELVTDEESIAITLSFWMLQDGVMSMSLDMGDGPAIIYFTKAEDADLSAVATSAVQGALAGIEEVANATVDAVDAGATDAFVESALEAAKTVAEASVDTTTIEAEDAHDHEDEHEHEHETEVTDEPFFHDPEGWMLDGEMNLTPELLDMFDTAMASEKRFAIQPILHLGTKIEEEYTTHCYLCVLGSLEDPDEESLFLIYIDEPTQTDDDPVFYAGLELMLTLSPYENAEE